MRLLLDTSGDFYTAVKMHK